jgi:hypothetical protein
MYYYIPLIQGKFKTRGKLLSKEEKKQKRKKANQKSIKKSTPF